MTPYIITVLSDHARVNAVLLGFGRQLEDNVWECFISEFEASNMVATHGAALRFERDGMAVQPRPVGTRSERRKTITSKTVKRRYANKRLDALNQAAIEAGFAGWRDLEKNVLKGAKITVQNV